MYWGGKIDSVFLKKKKKNYCYTLQILGSQWPCIKSASNKTAEKQIHQDVGRQTESPGAVRKFWKNTSSRRPSAWYRPCASQNLTSDNRHIPNGEACPISLRDTQALLLDALLYIVCFGIHSFIIQHPPEAKKKHKK